MKSSTGELYSRTGAILVSGAIVAALAVANTASAQSTTAAGATTGASGTHQSWGGRGGAGMAHNGVFGTVSAISGDMITISSKGYGANATTKTYTVDATNATVMKSNAASSVSAIAVGDTIMAQGTVSGTSVTATKIMDGMMMPGKGGAGMGPGMMGRGMASSTMAIKGNGQPVVGGTVSVVSGTTLTISNASNVTYTVDASSATIDKGNATSSISDVAVGDRVIVQGAVSGNSVTASSIIDQGAIPTSATGTTGSAHVAAGGFLGSIGSFFHKLFGFF